MKKLLSLMAIFTLPWVQGAETKQGNYLSHLADCQACHTSSNGEAFAGGVPFFTPMGTLYSTNITPDPTQGIGNYTLADFERAVRQGISKENQRLYPAMPYKQYSRFSDDDIAALYRYFMHDVSPSRRENGVNQLHWPFSMRWTLNFWNWLTPSPKALPKSIETNPQIVRGAFLVTGPGHCGACHTPRGILMQEVSMDPNDPRFLSGSAINGWYAPSLRNLPYSAEELVQLLKYGHNTSSAINGPMTEVVTNSTQYFTLADLNGMAAFLYTIQLPPSSAKQGLAHVMLPLEKRQAEADYNRNCSVCHGKYGEGITGVIPALQRNLIVEAADPASFINVVLYGASTPLTQGVMAWAMPGFKNRLSAERMANMLTWIRTFSPNSVGKVTVKQVKQQYQLRKPMTDFTH